MKFFRARVEPAEPMRGLEVPQQVVEALGGGKRPIRRIEKAIAVLRTPD